MEELKKNLEGSIEATDELLAKIKLDNAMSLVTLRLALTNIKLWLEDSLADIKRLTK